MFRALLKGRGCVRGIATSGKKNEGAVSKHAPLPPAPVTPADFSDTQRNWVSYGFDENDRATDENYAHLIFFTTISVVMVGCGFFLAYKPDNLLRDWSSREAFLELRRREALGLPLIDPNYVDPATIVLPSEEELKDVEIII